MVLQKARGSARSSRTRPNRAKGGRNPLLFFTQFQLFLPVKELNDNLTGLLRGNKGQAQHTQIKMEISWLASVRSQGRALQPKRRTRQYVGEQEGCFCDKPSQAAQLQAAPTARICQTTSPGNLCFVKLLRKCPGSHDIWEFAVLPAVSQWFHAFAANPGCQQKMYLL